MVLVLIGTELIFFTAACMGLCFVFVLEMLLIVQRCFLYCRAALKQSQSPHPIPPARRLGGHKDLGVNTAVTVDSKGCPISYGIMLNI